MLNNGNFQAWLLYVNTLQSVTPTPLKTCCCNPDLAMAPDTMRPIFTTIQYFVWNPLGHPDLKW